MTTKQHHLKNSSSLSSRTLYQGGKVGAAVKNKIWSPLEAELLSRSFMVENHSGGMIEPVPGFVKRRAMTGGLPGGQPSPKSKLRTESVIGPDDRREIAETAGIPWRSICHLLIERQDGRVGYGTGWFAGPRLIVTAGHCVLNHDGGQWASRISVVPGSNGTYPPPFGTAEIEEVKVHPRWENNADEDYDYGFLLLRDDTLGRSIGWFGFAVLEDECLESMIVNIAGYPDDKPQGTMWFNSGRITSTHSSHLLYMIDTEAGQSGAPVFWYGENQQRIVVAIHVASEADFNRGTRITQDIYLGIKELNER